MTTHLPTSQAKTLAFLMTSRVVVKLKLLKWSQTYLWKCWLMNARKEWRRRKGSYEPIKRRWKSMKESSKTSIIRLNAQAWRMWSRLSSLMRRKTTSYFAMWTSLMMSMRPCSARRKLWCLNWRHWSRCRRRISKMLRPLRCKRHWSRLLRPSNVNCTYNSAIISNCRCGSRLR